MRWLFLLLAVLNLFYFIWHQQGLPTPAKEVIALSMAKGSQPGIRLLKESQPGEVLANSGQSDCLYLTAPVSWLPRLKERLASLGITALPSGDAGWVVVESSKEGIQLDKLSLEIKDLKSEKKSCKGIASP